VNDVRDRATLGVADRYREGHAIPVTATRFVTVETSSQWETSSLLRKLRGHSAYAVQVEHDRWLVCSLPARSHPSVDALQALINEWAEEEGARPLAVRVGDEPVPLRAQR
jgi:hypothetical protein